MPYLSDGINYFKNNNYRSSFLMIMTVVLFLSIFIQELELYLIQLDESFILEPIEYFGYFIFLLSLFFLLSCISQTVRKYWNPAFAFLYKNPVGNHFLSLVFIGFALMSSLFLNFLNPLLYFFSSSEKFTLLVSFCWFLIANFTYVPIAKYFYNTYENK